MPGQGLDRGTARALRDHRLWVGFALLAAYALPLFFPPAAQPFVAPEGGLLERLFPGVPPAFVAVRILALAVGAFLVASAVGAALDAERPAESESHPPAGGASPHRVRWTVALAALLALSSLSVPWLGRAFQVTYVVLLFLPAWILARGERGIRMASAQPNPGPALPAAAAGLVALWVVLRLVASRGSPRAADPVDMWLGFEWLARAAVDGRNLLTEGFHPGQTALNQLLQGVSLIGPLGLEPSFSQLQLLHIAWTALVGLGIARLAALRLGPAAAPVAAATFLFSPFALGIPLNPSVLFVGPVFATAILLLLERVLVRASDAALVALGPLCGLAATNPALVPFCLVALGASARHLVRGAATERSVGVAALLLFFAAIAPALPGLAELPSMVREFTEGRGEWAGLESVLFGQRTPFDVPELWQAGRPGSLVVPLGALLSPFAIPRQPIRLWGDALFDPFGASLAAVAIVLLVQRVRRSPEARLALALLAAAVAPAFVSSYDRASLIRLFAAPVVLALFAGLGFEALRRTLAPIRPAVAALVTTLAIALGGTLLYDLVNPRILRTSWLGIAIETVDSPASRTRAGLVTYGGSWDLSWLHVGRIASQVPREPIPWLRFESAESLDLAAREGLELLLWSPALEEDARVSEAVCSRWPEAKLYTLWDRPHLSRAFAARRVDSTWQPPIPQERWEARRCDDIVRARP
jgi:hypothetical protein